MNKSSCFAVGSKEITSYSRKSYFYYSVIKPDFQVLGRWKNIQRKKIYLRICRNCSMEKQDI